MKFLKNKLGEKEARVVINYIEEQITNKAEEDLSKSASKEDLYQTRGLLLKEIGIIRSELTKTIYIVALIQFLAIVGSVIGIVSFMLKK